MNLSRKWLNEFVSVPVSDKVFSDAMTMSGSKVETITDLGSEITNVVVGRVISLTRHTNSNHMWICQVDVGEEGTPLQIVTGAQNVKVGDLVPVAKHGATLAGGVKIERGMLRGELSDGMLCSFQELGLESRDFPSAYENGIWILSDDPELDGCVPGADIRPIIGLDDHVIEFEITPNRPDCLSVIGLAREAAATFDRELHLHTPEVKGGAEGTLTDLLDVETPDADLVPRYTARMIRNVKIAPSPKWMRERLRAMGVRPINNIVDITNYVMLEYGQPMHAFDYRYVRGNKIIVRRAAEGEELTTLDGNLHKLSSNHLVIADETRAVGLAGIMGGENSEITEDTCDVVFESACFDGTCIRKGALALGMRTEASAKFEKGLDPMNTLPAVNRACELVEMLGAGEVVDGAIDILNFIPEPAVLHLEPEKINALLGTDISREEMVQILIKLGFGMDGDLVSIPSWRSDVHVMADLAEEVARFHGYDRIPCTLMRGQTTLGGCSSDQKLEDHLGLLCRSFGYDEIITFSFISPSYYDKIRWAEGNPRRQSFKILNPLGEDSSIMRTTILPSMLENLTRNDNYHNNNVRLYEIGRIYLPGGENGLARESKILSLGAYGDDMDFYVMKGHIESALQDLRISGTHFLPYTDNPSYHPGRCATVWSDSVCLGVFGQIHPLVLQNYGTDENFYCAELDVNAISSALGADPEYTPLPKYPAVNRDIDLVCDQSVLVGDLQAAICRGAGKHLKSVTLFDIYQGAGIPDGKKSVAFNLILQSENRSLSGEDADRDIQAILDALEADCGAALRS